MPSSLTLTLTLIGPEIGFVPSSLTLNLTLIGPEIGFVLSSMPPRSGEGLRERPSRLPLWLGLGLGLGLWSRESRYLPPFDETREMGEREWRLGGYFGTPERMSKHS